MSKARVYEPLELFFAYFVFVYGGIGAEIGLN
jgi:hypothetical protein